MPIIHFDNVSCLVLDRINLSVEEGQILAVMGKTGSGKTSLCKLINGTIPHLCGGKLSGSVTVDGIRTAKSSVPELSQIAGLVLDDPDLQLFTSTVKSEIVFGAENLLVPPQEIEIRAAAALSAVGLAGLENREAASLSGGEKQRLVIASFLSMKTKILVLDDPLCRLDPSGAENVLSVLKSLRAQYGLTVVITSHDSVAMQNFADKVCILNQGRIAAFDDAEKIFENSTLLEENGIQPPKEYDIHSYFVPADNISGLQDNNGIVPADIIGGLQIEINDLSFTYNTMYPSILSAVNLSFYENDFIAIIGQNGCGKTTLLKNITGLLKPASGDIYIRGRNTKEMTVSEISLEVGFVMQNPDTQLFTDSVYNEVSFGLRNAGYSKKQIDKCVKDALNTVGLKDKDAFPHALNYADRGKLVIACVLAMGCKILIFDEIDVGQDYHDSIKIMDIAKELHSKGYTIIFISHNIPLVCSYANRLIKMEKDGSISTWKRKN